MISSSIPALSLLALVLGSGLAKLSFSTFSNLDFLGWGILLGSLPPIVLCVRVGVPATCPHLLTLSSLSLNFAFPFPFPAVCFDCFFFKIVTVIFGGPDGAGPSSRGLSSCSCGPLSGDAGFAFVPRGLYLGFGFQFPSFWNCPSTFSKSSNICCVAANSFSHCFTSRSAAGRCSLENPWLCDLATPLILASTLLQP